MKENKESLRVSILKHLDENNGLDRYIDLVAPFSDRLSNISERLEFITTLSILEKDGLIEVLAGSNYRLMASIRRGTGKISPLVDYNAFVRLRHTVSHGISKNISVTISNSPGAISSLGNHLSSKTQKSHNTNKRAHTTPKANPYQNIMLKIIIGVLIGVLVWWITSYANHKWLHWY